MMAEQETITDVVEDMTETAQEAVEEVAKVTKDAEQVGTAVSTAEETVTWEDRYAGAQNQLNASFAVVHEARGSVTASRQQVESARSALMVAETAMTVSRESVGEAITSGIEAIDVLQVLLSEHRTKLVEAKAQL